MNTSITILVQSLGWGLLHSVWQGLLIYCCLRVVLKISGELTARIKYHLSVGAMAGSFAWFIYTCIAQYQRLQGVTIQVTQSGADPSTTRSYALNTLPVHSYNGMFSGIINFVEPFFPVLVTLYIAGIALLMIRLAVNLVQVRNYKTKGIVAADVYWSEWVRNWQDKLDISRKVRLFFSEKINVPMTMGALKPVILLPLAGMNNLSQDQLEAILLHELAHIKRHDYLFNIIQTVVETVLFFNPFTWLISRIIRKEREHCCDDVVLEYMNSPLPYARALAELEVQRHNTISLAATGSKYQLLNRIKRIMEMKKSTVNYTQFGVAALLIVALIVSVAWFSPVLAQTKKTTKEKKGNKTVTTTISTNKSGNTKAVTRTIIIDDKGKNNHGVHPNDVGNEEDIKKRVEEAMAEVDWQGINKDVHVAVANIDWDQVGSDVQVALNDVDWDELKKEMANARVEIRKIDWDKIDDEVDNALSVLNDPKIKKQIEIEIDNARKGNKQGKVMAYAFSGNDDGKGCGSSYSFTNNQFDEMFAEMENEGLIDRTKGFSIKKRNGELSINGKKQPGSVLRKYDSYLGDAKEVSINGSKGNMSISIEK